METWIWWLVAAGVLAALEISTLTLFAGMLSVGAGAAMIAGLVGGGIVVQVVAFSVVSLGMIAVVRPVARRHLQQPSEIRTGVDALLGSDAVVLETVTESDGRVKLAGEVWSARTLTGAEFPPGSVVQVLQIDGATAIVG